MNDDDENECNLSFEPLCHSFSFSSIDQKDFISIVTTINITSNQEKTKKKTKDVTGLKMERKKCKSSNQFFLALLGVCVSAIVWKLLVFYSIISKLLVKMVCVSIKEMNE